MKKLLFIIYLGILLSCMTARAQYISDVQIIPSSNPTADDSITVITECSFSNNAYSVINQVYIDTTTHTINIQLFKCKYSTPPSVSINDTFHLGQLSIASWNLNVMLFIAQYDTITSTCGTFSMTDTDNTTIVVSQPGPVTGTAEHPSDIIRLYPNPAQGILHISGTASHAPSKLHIMTLQGQVVMQKALDNISNAVNIEHLQAGLYLYMLETAGNTVKGKLVISQK